jgi:hypothetical protein
MAGVAACAARPQPDPALRIPEADFRARIHTLCLNPLRATVDLREAKTRLLGFEDLLQERLRAAGFALVSSDQVLETWRRAAADAGGYFDRDSGRRDEAKFDVVKQQALRTLQEQFGCDAILTPTIALVLSSWTNGVAEWDGMQDQLAGGWGAHGRVPALSLWISMRDLQDNEIYFGTGGIQVTAKLEGFFVEKFAQVSMDTLLTDRQRNLQAIHASLQPLLGAAPLPTPSPVSLLGPAGGEGAGIQGRYARFVTPTPAPQAGGTPSP